MVLRLVPECGGSSDWCCYVGVPLSCATAGGTSGLCQNALFPVTFASPKKVLSFVTVLEGAVPGLQCLLLTAYV